MASIIYIQSADDRSASNVEIDKILNKKYSKSQIAQTFNRLSKVFKSLLDKDKDEQEDLF